MYGPIGEGKMLVWLLICWSILYVVQEGGASLAVALSITSTSWRDVFSGCAVMYYDLFHHMENTFILDPGNDVHIFCLHYVYLPRINESLRVFAEGWNNHPLSSQSNLSPLQLWVSGLSRRSTSPTFAEVIASIY